MKQPWIHNAKTDWWFILSPPFLILLIIFLFHKQIQRLEDHYSFYTWLFLIVFVDVAHVYSTLFKTYFVKSEIQKRKWLYIGIPIISWGLGIILFQLGSLTFWSVLALVAVFHFIRQQYGFMRIYARFEPGNWSKRIDEVAVYAATIYPMLYWFKTPRAFTWFVNNEFTWLNNLPDYLSFITPLYFAILIIWGLKTVFEAFKTKVLNIPKTMLIIGTYLSWYFGIVYFNNDLLFTLLNVISHGIPYIALIYIREIRQKENNQVKWMLAFKSFFGIFLFFGVILCFALLEELLWESLVWNEHFSLDLILSESLLQFVVPLLVVPQLTHYLLDGFIWRKPKKVN
ncbi:hypothetical protein C1637_04750 [Chryseobacterium lactis]|uniref:Beta-carotene 15,15'-monooxygenase n=1 Tax=Chryseobacterium lactis TaxID=1241981 RepID=A0A3G6RSY0_CHRLC|nr:hypothetical protein [Chryseobacterium lactis]AZA81886.1 hypothetical protein EG342_08140 [Chryseobacterium lactis]AZB06883.1 hypothetical protein EG341_24255 [Chryseobacterium lactis]PNW15736.1 hypothetical protein C1637_04750 [Chryseobacterium lactis]